MSHRVFNCAVIALLVFIFACKSEPVDQTSTQKKKETDEPHETELPGMPTGLGGKADLKAYYSLPHIQEFYEWQEMEYVKPSPLVYPADLSTYSYADLRLLRNEVFARNGYLFDDAFLRGYFNCNKWYMPIFDVDTFRVSLDKDELALVERVKEEEAKRKAKATVDRDGLALYNAELVVNGEQFDSLPVKILADLDKQNFCIVDAKRSMPFYVYDKNAYQFIPHYISTDLYLFILHKYFSRFLEKLDEGYMYARLSDVLKGTGRKLEMCRAPDYAEAVEWARFYITVANYALDGSVGVVPNSLTETFAQEKKAIDGLGGTPAFIPNRFVDYSELMPRGHYTKSDSLQGYFRAFKWMSLNGIDIKDDKQLRGTVVLAHAIKTDGKLNAGFKSYVGVVEKLAGKEDNLSLTDLVGAVSEGVLQDQLSDGALAQLRARLGALDKDKVQRVFGESFKTEERQTKRLCFLSSTYSITGDVFSKLVHIDGAKSKRPFPRGLDLPAAFGSAKAQEILLHEDKETAAWPEYQPKLKALQQQFAGFADWDANYGFKGVQTALAASAEQDNYPAFMKTDAYNRKELSTSLASWAHIKHDLILYQEKPFAAECGQGGGPEPPQHYSYVEPNRVFWGRALELVDWLTALSAHEPIFADELGRIKELGLLLREVVRKELAGIKVTDEEYNQLHYVGGTVEYILLGLLETDHLPDRERSMALIADVYQYNGVNMNVAVGHADDIYVVVPIRGEYYLARGAVFSYYEFTGELYTDEKWREQVTAGNAPVRPDWMAPLVNMMVSPEGKLQFRAPGI